ncbi:MAG: DUF4080 domain-containing protein [Magnetococcales bacterium]|nr:DUF4080 domain-containing protein [Magnetococcales bacterium]
MSPGGIVLMTLNARFRHPSLGLRCLKANLDAWSDRCSILEFTIHDRPMDIAETVLRFQPAIIGIGVYLWNVEPVRHLLALLKVLAPEIILILGGPEMVAAPEDDRWFDVADVIISGEGEGVFRDVCREWYATPGIRPAKKRITAPPVDFTRVKLPYALYDSNDLKHRFTYVEASRGCPHGCSFCLSARDAPIRRVPLAHFFSAMEDLLTRGARQFKFVDRTFNVHTRTAVAILDFFLERYIPGLFLHFEMVPDHLPPALKESLIRFPPGSLQLEIGFQTFDGETLQRIHRSQNNDAAAKNLAWLKNNTRVHLHTDLIFGLPGESLVSMEAGFNRLFALHPHDIQVGILKRLPGTQLARQDPGIHSMWYNPHPPYDILANDHIDFATMQRLRRFGRYWDLIGNSQRFPTFISWMHDQPSPFAVFLTLSDFIFATTRQTHQIALARLITVITQGLIQALKLEPAQARAMMSNDWPDYGSQRAEKS